jgi:iron complex transport system permease protein
VWITKQAQPTTLLALTILLLGAGVAALFTGTIDIGLASLFDIARPDHQSARLIVMELRLPRVLLAGLVGAILALGGVVMQALFRNPLADPSLIGVTAGASLGASLAIVLFSATGVGLMSLTTVSVGAFVGGLAASYLVYQLAKRGSEFSVSTMLLAGIAITALAGSLGNLMDFFADNAALRQISLWRMGGLDSANFERVAVVAGPALLLMAAALHYRKALNVMLLGDSQARYLGIDVSSVRNTLIIAVAIAVCTSVAMGGTIAFIGLIIPHMARLLFGPSHTRLIPAASVLGAFLLICADTIARTVLAPVELPAGVITALLGVPFFLYLLNRGRTHA